MCENNKNETTFNETNTFNSCGCSAPQQHVHEIVGSTFIAERCEDPHNHRFATVSGEAVPFMNSHVHNIRFRTDSYDGHFHEFSGTSSPAIPVGDGRHVHFAKAFTTTNDGHRHEFRVAALIDNPIEDEA